MHELPLINLVHLREKLLQSKRISRRLSWVTLGDLQRIPLVKDLPHFGEITRHLGHIVWQIIWDQENNICHSVVLKWVVNRMAFWAGP